MLLSKISIGSRRKLPYIATETTTVLKRLLITKKSEGVYSFEPDSILHSNAPASDLTVTPQDPYYERPTPVVFIAGEGLPAKIWFDTANYFSQRGFSGLLLSIPDSCHNYSVYTTVDYFESKRSEFGLIPPVFVAHSVSSFLSQKYLESYSLKGLVLVNPIPPFFSLNKMSVTFAQYGDWDDRGDMRWPRHDRIIQEYYHLECEVLDTPAFPVRLMKSLDVDENEEAFVCLEKGEVPILIVSTTYETESSVRMGSKNSKIDKTSIISPPLRDTTISSICTLHGVQPENVVVLSSRTSAPMIDTVTANEFNKTVFDFIDSL